MKTRNAIFALVVLFGCCLGGTGRLEAVNLHLVESLPNGFRMYRSGVPNRSDLREWNELGVQEIAVLSGDADEHEFEYPHLVPDLEVVYNKKQDSSEPLSAEFLEWFDSWVQEARREGKVIAFRCRCGCHRTGRVAAYYQMKYQHLDADEAIAVMNEHGKRMFLHRHLGPQVRALADYIHGRPCSQEPEYCVREDRTR